MELRILITGGGTGGHAVPAIATARAITDLLAGSDTRPVFRYIGSKLGIEKKLAQEAGIEFVGIETGKLRRTRNPIAMISRANVRDMLRVPVGLLQAMREVARFQPDVVFSTGGYVSVPAVLAASAQKRPVVAHEQTVQIGLANRIVMRRAVRIALSYPESKLELSPRQQARATVTGNPVRDAVLSGNRRLAGKRLGFETVDNRLPMVYVTGGAQGARIINTAVGEELGPLLTIARIVHQCGNQSKADEQDYDKLTVLAAALPEHLRMRYRLTKFVGDEIGDVYALADLIVGRSGAGTVSEVCAVGKPALFIPLVPTGGDEQTRNAKRLTSIGAASILPQDELSGERLLVEVTQLLSNEARLNAMGNAASTLALPNAARDLANMVIEAARG